MREPLISMKRPFKSLKVVLGAAITDFKYVLKDGKRKSLLKIIYEAVNCCITERAAPIHYFTNFLYRKECENYSDYVSYKAERILTNKLNDSRYSLLINNKLNYDLYFSRHIKELPELLAYNIKDNFFIQKEKRLVNSSKSFLVFLRDILKVSESVFIKPAIGYGGHGSYRVDRDKLDHYTPDEVSDMYESLTSSSFVIQRTVKQNAEVDQINSSCINTIRFNSYFNDDNKVEIISAFMRFGRDGNFVDNLCSGGFFVPIDMDTGRLIKNGRSDLCFGGSEYDKHPDSGFPLNGFTIPHFEQAVDLVKRAHGLVPPLRILGWDVAISDKGPILIEGNDGAHLGAGDSAYGGYKKNPVFSRILEKHL